MLVYLLLHLYFNFTTDFKSEEELFIIASIAEEEEKGKKGYGFITSIQKENEIPYFISRSPSR